MCKDSHIGALARYTIFLSSFRLGTSHEAIRPDVPFNRIPELLYGNLNRALSCRAFAQNGPH
jgi:hypothetical protein